MVQHQDFSILRPDCGFGIVVKYFGVIHQHGLSQGGEHLPAREILPGLAFGESDVDSEQFVPSLVVSLKLASKLTSYSKVATQLFIFSAVL